MLILFQMVCEYVSLPSCVSVYALSIASHTLILLHDVTDVCVCLSVAAELMFGA